MLEKANSLYNHFAEWVPLIMKIAVAIWGVNHSFEKFLTFVEQVKINYAKSIKVFRRNDKSIDTDSNNNLLHNDSPGRLPKVDGKADAPK